MGHIDVIDTIRLVHSCKFINVRLCSRELDASVESKIEAQTSSAKTVAKVGSDVSLWCNATGYPKPVVYWTREDRNRRLPDGNQQFWVPYLPVFSLAVCCLY